MRESSRLERIHKSYVHNSGLEDRLSQLATRGRAFSLLSVGSSYRWPLVLNFDGFSRLLLSCGAFTRLSVGSSFIWTRFSPFFVRPSTVSHLPFAAITSQRGTRMPCPRPPSLPRRRRDTRNAVPRRAVGGRCSVGRKPTDRPTAGRERSVDGCDGDGLDPHIVTFLSFLYLSFWRPFSFKCLDYNTVQRFALICLMLSSLWIKLEYILRPLYSGSRNLKTDLI